MPLQPFAAAARVSRCPLLGLILTNLFRNGPDIYFPPPPPSLTSVLQRNWQCWSLYFTKIHSGDSFNNLCLSLTGDLLQLVFPHRYSPAPQLSPHFFFLKKSLSHLPPPYLFLLPSHVFFPPPCIFLYLLSVNTPFSPASSGCLAWGCTTVPIIYYFYIPKLCHTPCL